MTGCGPFTKHRKERRKRKESPMNYWFFPVYTIYIHKTHFPMFNIKFCRIIFFSLYISE